MIKITYVLFFLISNHFQPKPESIARYTWDEASNYKQIVKQIFFLLLIIFSFSYSIVFFLCYINFK